MNWIASLIGSNYNEKQIKKLQPLVDQINKYDNQRMDLTDAEVKAKTLEFKSRLQGNENTDDLLPEAFAVVKQACRRMVGMDLQVKDEIERWDMVPYDVQLIGGIVLHQGKVAEMRTGEGKTLVATLPAYLNALTGNPVHVVTVNDYLASRDAEWMGHLYKRLGLTVGSINKFTPNHEHKTQYEADIVYVESTEIGFDYLRDNLEKDPKQRRLLNRGLHFAIVDEADSVFIDEARTPMIMSQANQDPVDKYKQYSAIVKTLQQSTKAKKVSKGFIKEIMEGKEEDITPDGDYYLDEKSKSVTLSEQGITKLEAILNVENIYKDLGYDEIHQIENALSAKAAYTDGKEYIIQNGEVMIVDENTGRIMPGRRFQGGLHQAIEAKEGLTIKQEAKTIATITYQHFFKLYNKLAGMTGTATTEGEELEKIYNLEVLSIPTNRPIHRADRNDRVFFDQNSKWKSVINTVQFYNSIGQPILIGTSSIHTSELVSKLLRESTINHYVLNAKFFEQEANIVSNGGQLNSVIVATNMAGRGTDIKLDKGLNTKIAENYAKWIKQTVTKNPQIGRNLNISSKTELDLLTQALGLDRSTPTNGMSKEVNDIYYKLKLNKGATIGSYAQLTLNQSGATIANRETKDIQFGLFVLGTEKHESRRIDNQLRGRAGRQGDPGVSQFYVSFDDEIMRKMGGGRMQSIINMAGSMAGDQSELEDALSNKSMFTNSILRAQTQMEAHNYSTRKHLYDYDSVVNKQRLKVYGKRDEILQDSDGKSDKNGTKNSQDTKEITTVLIDAIRCIVDSDEDDESNTRKLNIELADYLRTLTQKVMIVTNANEEKLEQLKQLLTNYDFEIVSYHGTPSKSEPEYFTKIIQEYQLDLDTIYYVDHRESNHQSAQQAGIHHVHLHNDTQDTIEQIGLICKPSIITRFDTIAQSPMYTEIKGWINEIVRHLIVQHKKLGTNKEELLETLKQDFVIEWTEDTLKDIMNKGNLTETLTTLLESQFDRRSRLWDPNMVHQYIKNLYLDVLDEQWIEHIDTMQHLRDKVSLYGYAQQDPLLIYKAESYDLFEQLWIRIKSKILNTIFRQIQQHDDNTIIQPVIEVQNVVDTEQVMTNADQIEQVIDNSSDDGLEVIYSETPHTSSPSSNVNVIAKSDRGGKVGPNDPCPCGSGKKYKKCCGMK